MDYNFFSLNREEDWRKGQFYNVEVENNSIQIETSKRYIFEKTINRSDLLMNDLVKSCAVNDSGNFYYIDKDYKIRMYDVDANVSEVLIDKTYNDTKTFSMPKIFYSNNMLYVLHNDGTSKIDVISIVTGQVDECVSTVDDKLFICLAFYVDAVNNLYIFTNKGILYCINRKTNLKDKYDLNKLIRLNCEKLIESAIILKGYNNQYVVFYNKNDNQLYHIDLNENTVHKIDIKNISSIGIYKSNVIINKEENIKSSIYVYRTRTKTLEKLPFIVGKTNDIELDRYKTIYAFNYEKDVIKVLKEKKGVNFNVDENAYKGIYYTSIFDSTKEGTMWDKVVLDAYIPQDCLITLSYYAFDETDIYYQDIKQDFYEFLTAKSVQLSDKEKFMEGKWINTISNFSKALFRDARGRYMLIRIEIWGNSTQSPKLNKLRVFYDRQTYTKYLPEIYSDENKDSFLDRYLSMFETFMLDIEEKIDFISDNFDADRASPEMLRWICTWMDIEIDMTWTDDKIRKLIKRAPYIFKRRGTKDAISEILSIYLGTRPIIIENFQLDSMRQNSEMTGLVNSLYGDNPYSYTILVNLTKELNKNEKLTIKRILDNESPAYCTYKFIVLQPWMALDKHTYLGINSQILNWSNLVLDGKSILPYNAILTDKQTSNINEK